MDDCWARPAPQTERYSLNWAATPDCRSATPVVGSMRQMLRQNTVRTEMADEARMLATFQLAQERLKEVLKMPNQDANRVIRSVKENGWRVSGKLKAEYPIQEDERTAQRVVEALQSAFEDGRAREPLRPPGRKSYTINFPETSV